MSPGTESVYREKFTQSLNQLFSKAWRVCRNNPVQGLFLLQSYQRQKRKAAIRCEAAKQGVPAPPVLIFSMTSQCNLHCKGCYAKSREAYTEELPLSRISHLFSEASAMGVGVILLAGGEPLMKPEVLWEAGKHKDIIFPVFTNGMLLNEGSINYFRKNRNLIPVLSAEGGEHRTDMRRGSGVYTKLLRHMEKLQNSRQIYGLSLTLTSANFDEITHPVWLNSHRNLGSSLFFMVEYVPQHESEIKLCLTSEQKALLPGRIEILRKQIPALFISLPGDEEKYGGCLAGGRGFAHISASGNLEPCPFAPYSDMSLKDHSLKEALQSPFMKIIQESHQELGEASGGCTLWKNREWVMSQLESV